MLGTARLLTFAFRALVLVLLIAILWVSVAERYNEALVSLATPLFPSGVAAGVLGYDIVFSNPNSSVSIDGLTLHFGLILMAVVVLAAVGIGVIPRLGWLLAMGTGAFGLHVLGVASLARGLAWASETTSPEHSGRLVFSVFAVFWGLLPAAIVGAWCFLYWIPRVSGKSRRGGEEGPAPEVSSRPAAERPDTESQGDSHEQP